MVGSHAVDWIKGMTPVERHAELVYAESLFEKACRVSVILSISNVAQALLGIIYSGDWLAFIKEACVVSLPAPISTHITQS